MGVSATKTGGGGRSARFTPGRNHATAVDLLSTGRLGFGEGSGRLPHPGEFVDSVEVAGEFVEVVQHPRKTLKLGQLLRDVLNSIENLRDPLQISERL